MARFARSIETKPFLEQRSHGDALFPVASYGNNRLDASTVLGCHWHREAEFISVVSGSARLQIEDCEHVLQAGDIAYISSSQLHAGKAEGCDCVYNAIVFDLEFLSSHSSDSAMLRYLSPIVRNELVLEQVFCGQDGQARSIIEAVQTAICENEQHRLGYELVVKAQLCLALGLMVRSYSRKGNPDQQVSYKTQRLKQALSYIHEHYAGKLTIAEISRYVGMSEGHFCRFFKQMTSRTPVDYINEYRIGKAAQLLKSTDRKIYDIAMDCGFYNLSYFIRTFSSYLGYTPSQFRSLAEWSDGEPIR